MITPLADNLVEPTETVILTYTDNGTYNITPASSTVSITDNPPVVTVTTTNASESGPTAGSFIFARTGGNLAQALAIGFSIGGTAGNGVDYSGIGSSFVIPANMANAALTITPLPDALTEGTETVVLTFTNNGTYNISPPSATVNIADLVVQPGITITAPLIPLAGTAQGTVTLPGNVLADTAIGLLSGNTGILTVPTTVTVLAGQSTASVPITGVSLGTTSITASAAGFTSGNVNATVTSAVITIAPVTLGPSATGTTPVTLSSPAPAGGLVITLASSVPSIMSIAPVTVTVPAGASFASPNPTVTAGATLGTTTLTATAAGYAGGNAVGKVALIAALSPSPLNTAAGRSDAMTVSISQPAPAGGLAITLTSSDPAKFTVPATVTIPAGNLSVGFNVTGVAAGNGNTLTASGAQISTATATVNVAAAPGVVVNILNVGKDLQSGGSFQLQAPAPAGGVVVTLTSNDPSRLLLSANATTPGAVSVNVNVLGNGTSGTFEYQALQDNGTVQVVATATGYAQGTASTILRPSGFFLSSGAINTTTLSANTAIQVCAAQLAPGTLANEGAAILRAGVSPVSIAMTSSNTTVGVLANSPRTMGGNEGCISQDAGGQLQFDPLAAGTTTLTLVTPAGYTTPASLAQSLTATVSAAGITVNAPNLGKDLEIGGTASLQAPAPAGGVVVTITSSDPTRLLIAPNGAMVGSASINVTVPFNQSTASFVYQALQDNGTVQVTATAPGYAGGAASTVLRPSGFFVNGSVINTTTLSANTNVQVCVAQLSPGTLANEGAANLRFGVTPISIAMTSSQPAVGVLTNSPRTIAGAEGCISQNAGGQLQFDPLAAGTTTLTLVQPAGFSTPATLSQASVATVTATGITMNVPNVGKDLQAGGSITLQAPAPAGGAVVTIASSDPTRLLIAPNGSTAGSTSINVTIPVNQSTATFTMQALQDNGTVQVTASTPGFSNGVASSVLRPSGLFISTGPIFTTTLSANTTVQVCVAQLSPGSLGNEGSGTLRFGVTPLSVAMSSSNTTVGVLTNSPRTLGGAEQCISQDAGGQLQFDPLSAGTTTLSLTQPPGFATPAGLNQSILATVTSTGINVAVSNLGKDLQVGGSATLQAPAGAGGVVVTITSSDPSRLLIAPNATTAGSGSINVTVPSGASTATFTLQALQDNGTVQVTAAATGYTSGAGTSTLRPSGLYIASTGFTTPASGGNVNVQVCVAQLAPVTLANEGSGTLRFGVASAAVVMTSSNTTVGVITNSPRTLAGDQQCISGNAGGQLVFDPLTVGATTLGLTQPIGFSTPASLAQTINATVN